MRRGRRAALLLLTVIAWSAAAAAPTPAAKPASKFEAGCFPGAGAGAELYEMEISVFAGARPAGPPTFGGLSAYLIYPAACDAGNWSKRRFRRGHALNLHADVMDGRCHDYDAWVERNPFLTNRFTLSLLPYTPIEDMEAVILQTAPAGGGALSWRPTGGARADGLRPLALQRAETPVDDAFDRWAAIDGAGRPKEFLICRKTGDVWDPACDHHTIFDRARLRLAYGRRHLARLREIEGFGRKLLRCALSAPLP